MKGKYYDFGTEKTMSTQMELLFTAMFKSKIDNKILNINGCFVNILIDNDVNSNIVVTSDTSAERTTELTFDLLGIMIPEIRQPYPVDVWVEDGYRFIYKELDVYNPSKIPFSKTSFFISDKAINTAVSEFDKMVSFIYNQLTKYVRQQLRLKRPFDLPELVDFSIEYSSIDSVIFHLSELLYHKLYGKIMEEKDNYLKDRIFK